MFLRTVSERHMIDTYIYYIVESEILKNTQ